MVAIKAGILDGKDEAWLGSNALGGEIFVEKRVTWLKGTAAGCVEMVENN